MHQLTYENFMPRFMRHGMASTLVIASYATATGVVHELYTNFNMARRLGARLWLACI